MKKLLIFILFFTITNTLFAQKEAANWFFGDRAGLDFNSGAPQQRNGKLVTKEGCASISDRNGGLLFYTDGSTVWDRKHKIMPNGTGLLGHRSSTQSAIIVPKPGSNKIYYIFTVDSADKSDERPIKYGLNYSEVDMSKNNGLGDIVTVNKNTHLVTYNPNNAKQNIWKCSEKIAAIQNSNGDAFWVMTYFVDTFYTFKVDRNGVNKNPIKTQVNETINIIDINVGGSGIVNVTALGYLKISPDGKKLAIAHSTTANTRKSGKVYLYNFNDATGTTSTNGVSIIGGTYPYGLEFSPKSKKLYASVSNYETIRGNTTFINSKIFQYNILSSNIASTKKEIFTDSEITAGALQLALDGKIYRAKSKLGSKYGEPSLAVINKPELDGDLCDYKHNAVDLNSTLSGIGLPPFISSFFLFNFDYEFTCFEDNTHFYLTSEEPFDSLIWDFGDGNTSTDEDAYHTYASPGSYIVSLTTINDGEPNDPIKKTIEIVDLVEVMDTPFELTQCDSNDSDPTDGKTTFNLQLANDPISLGNGDSVDVFYYEDLASLNNDIENLNSLPDLYRNTVRDKELFAKVIKSGSDCFGIGSVILKTTESGDFTSAPLIGCDIGDGEAQYNLTDKKELIINELGLTGTTAITYHNSKDDASIGYNPLDEDYISNPKTIYIRVENNNICYGVGDLELQVFTFPTIKLEEEFNYCETTFPVKINGGIETSEENNYLYEWNTGAVTQGIEVSEAGDYFVNIIHKETSCSKIKNIKINPIEKPILDKVEIQNNSINNTAIIHLVNEGDFQYTLNDLFGVYQDFPTFTDLAPGKYTAYIKDSFSCNIVETEFYILGFPKFMTPNNDNQNDTWKLLGVDFNLFDVSDIYIFNRFGKIMAIIDPKGDGWNGNYNGKTASSGDYWFKVQINDLNNEPTIYKGHFSLIR